MKIALGLYGLVGSTTNKNGEGIPLDPKIAANFYHTNIINVNDHVDVFIHTWSHSFQQKLINLYQPKSIITEEQISFKPLSHLLAKTNSNHGIRTTLSNYLRPVSTTSQEFADREKAAFRACSRWYSVFKVNELMHEYEINNDFEYDFVMQSRLDVGIFTPINFAQYDPSCFWASHWNHAPKKDSVEDFSNNNLGKGFLDFWFFSSSKNMNLFSKLYLNIYDYHLSPHFSAYQHAKKCGFDINYTLYRWRDHEMIRRKYFNSLF